MVLLADEIARTLAVSVTVSLIRSTGLLLCTVVASKVARRVLGASGEAFRLAEVGPSVALKLPVGHANEVSLALAVGVTVSLPKATGLLGSTAVTPTVTRAMDRAIACDWAKHHGSRDDCKGEL